MTNLRYQQLNKKSLKNLILLILFACPFGQSVMSQAIFSADADRRQSFSITADPSVVYIYPQSEGFAYRCSSANTLVWKGPSSGVFNADVNSYMSISTRPNEKTSLNITGIQIKFVGWTDGNIGTPNFKMRMAYCVGNAGGSWVFNNTNNTGSTTGDISPSVVKDNSTTMCSDAVVQTWQFATPITTKELVRIRFYFFNGSGTENVGLISMKLIGTVVPDAPREKSVDIVVNSDQRQTFKGFGVAFAAESVNLSNVPETVKQALYDSLVYKSKVHFVRLWADPFTDNSTVATLKSQFVSSYVTSGVLANMTSRGVTDFLYSGTSGHPSSVRDYVAKVAEVIKEVKDETGFLVNYTGLANEPNASGWTSQELVDGVTYLRSELDKRSLQAVKIVATEASNADGTALNDELMPIMNNAASLAALGAMATHSYNMAATTTFANLAKKYNLDYWITEAGSVGGEEPVKDDSRAADQIARALNDLNQMVTHWCQFLGVIYRDNWEMDPDIATKVFVYSKAQSAVSTSLKYFYYKNLFESFLIGTKMRLVNSPTENEMIYSYGDKPALNVAAGINPDGKWVIGIVNNSGNLNDDPPLAVFGNTQSIRVNITVNELTNVPSKKFKLKSSSRSNPYVSNSTFELVNGRGTLTVNPLELLVLEEIKGIVTAIEQPKANTFVVFPNPCNGEKISVKKTNAEAVSEISVYNLAGIQYPARFASTGDITDVYFNGKLPSGMYLMRLKSGNKVSLVKYIVAP